MRNLLGRVLFFLGAMAFSWGCAGFAVLHGPASPEAVTRVADAFVKGEEGQKVLAEGAEKAAVAAGLDESTAVRVREAVLENDEVARTAAYEISAAWTEALGETPDVRGEGVKTFQEATRDALLKAGLNKKVAEAVSFDPPTLRMPMAKTVRGLAEKHTWPLLRAAGVLFGLCVVVASSKAAASRRVGRTLLGASVFYVALGVGVPRLMDESGNTTVRFGATLLRESFSGVVMVALGTAAVGVGLMFLGRVSGR